MNQPQRATEIPEEPKKWFVSSDDAVTGLDFLYQAI
jgi:hypothetical protein